MSGDGSSPLDRLRASYQARQEADPSRYVDIWPDGELVAKVARTDDVLTARGVLRTMAALVEPDLSQRIQITPENLADILVAVTVSLHARNGDAEAIPDVIPTEAGTPLRFDADFGKTIGVPEVDTPRGAVFAAFTSPAVADGPPTLDTTRLLTVVTNVCNMLSTGRELARTTVGKGSPPGTSETRP